MKVAMEAAAMKATVEAAAMEASMEAAVWSMHWCLIVLI